MKTLTLCITIPLLMGAGRLAAATYPSTYDVVYDRISISVNPGVSAAISSGTVTTWFKTTAPALATIGFDLDQAMTVSSITWHGATLSATTNYSHSSNVLLVTFPTPIAVQGTLDSVTINYSGTPVTPTTSIPSGYNRSAHSTGNYIIYTLDEAFTAHDWWPCKDSLVDKIDSVDLIVTTPSTYKVGGNGIGVEVISGSNKITTWKTRYPIATYLINFAVANYTDYMYTITTGLTTPVALPVHNYLFPEGNTTANQTALNSIQTILPSYVSLLNADYPFLNEKYGTAECANFGGALEVQSMTFVSSGSYTASILAHELSHQWFGDRLTTNDWHQIWLNEGFAEFFQYVIYPQNLLSAASALSSRQSLKTAVTNSSTTYVSNIANVDDIFIPSSSLAQPYEKGAMTLSMLRAWLGDTRFFTALHNYQNAPGLAYNFTSVDSLHAYMQAAEPNATLNLTNFFNDWVTKQGRVTYAVNYQFASNGISFNLVQSPTTNGAGYFDMPVPIEIKGNNGLDTTVVIIDQRGSLYNSVTGASSGSTIHYNLSSTPTSVTFDPNSLVLATASSIIPVTTLPVTSISFSAVRMTAGTQLSWEISTDEALQAVTVEKSADGTSFAPLVILDVQQTAYDEYTGAFQDNRLADGPLYYRLKVIEKDGSVDYSVVRMVDATGTGQLLVIPNPVTDYFSLLIPESFGDGQTISLLIYNDAGQLVRQNLLPAGQQITSPVWCQGLAPGVYEIMLINDKKRTIQASFIKR